MSRFARVVVPGYPHHVVQRGVRSMPIFLCDGDRRVYLRILAEESEKAGFDIHYYALMDTHVHHVGIPAREDSLACALGECHRRYTTIINERTGTHGFLFQGRFYSCPLDETHYVAAARYVERNPVRARMVPHAWTYRWSSARYHVGMTDTDPLISPDSVVRNPVWQSYMPPWRELLETEPHESWAIRKATKTGRPCGDKRFVKELERITDRILLPAKRGPKQNNREFWAEVERRRIGG